MNLTDAATLAREKMREHRLDGWKFRFDRAKRRAGSCRYPSFRENVGTITLSQFFVSRNGREQVEDTILHEIAHALAGSGHGHDWKWRTIAKNIGATPERCYDSDEVDMPKGRYRATCPGCSREFSKHRRPKVVRRWCKECGPERGEIVYHDTYYKSLSTAVA